MNGYVARVRGMLGTRVRAARRALAIWSGPAAHRSAVFAEIAALLEEEATLLEEEAARFHEEHRLAALERDRLAKIAELSRKQPIAATAGTDALSPERDETAFADARAAHVTDRQAAPGDVALDPLRNRLIIQKRRMARGVQRSKRLRARAEARTATLERLRDRAQRRAEKEARAARARTARRDAQRRKSQQGAAHARHAREAWDRGDFVAATEAWSAFAALDPENPMPRVGRVSVLRRLGDFDGARAEYHRFAEVLADDPARDLPLAKVASTAQMLDRANAHVDRMVEAGPLSATGWTWAFTFNRRHGRPAALLRTLDACLGDPDIRALFEADDVQSFARARADLLLDLDAVGWSVSDRGAPPAGMQLHREAARAICARPEPALRYEPVPGRVMLVLPSFGPGGVQRQALNLVRFLADRAPGLERIVILPLKGDEALEFHRAALEDLGAAFADAVPEGPLPPVEGLPEDAGRLLDLLPERYGREVRHVAAQIRAWRPETVHAWTDPINAAAGLAAVLAGTPRLVMGARSSAPTGRRETAASPFLRTCFAALLQRPGSMLTTNCRAAAAEFEDWLGCDAARIRTIYNGVDVDAMLASRTPERAAALRAALDVPPEAPLVVAAFRISPEKRPLLWVEAAARVAERRPDVHFAMLGDGVLHGAVQDAVAARGLGGRIHLPGVTREVENWIEASTAVLLTSTFEGTANIVLEAQALGRPVIAPAVGGLPEAFLPGETGLLSAPDPEAEALAALVLEVLDDPRIAEGARQRGEAFIRDRFGIARFVDGHRTLYGLAPD
ncbi:glycosyltransferase [Jannaschia sp. W003]|uniref:glycosyltransferase n=1 Tax=Jannaschia sp. W003 TaxID=2867012 RepID=UPI0021A54B0B|nr:glycosyltransferase [Jannaschia sp. W003]UWQ23100.1 glycosyltransferase [Jannaschia sp. W003]